MIDFLKYPITLLFAFVCFSSESAASGNNYFFRHITVEDGLAHTDGTDVAQDEQGFIWIGTNGGLQRFDGKKLSLFINEETSLGAVYNNRIKDLEVGNNGMLWVGTEGGLKLFDTYTNRYLKIIPQGDEDAEVLSQSIVEIRLVSASQVVILTNSGLFRFEIKDGNVVDYNVLAILSLKEGLTGDILLEENGDLWAVYKKNLILVRSGDLKNRNGGINVDINLQGRDEGYYYSSLESINDSSILIGVQNGFIEIDKKIDIAKRKTSGILYMLPESLISEYSYNINIVGIKKGEDNSVWLASNVGLVNAHKRNESYSFDLYRHNDYDPNSITANHINSLYKDRSGNLWVTSYNGGVNYIDLSQRQFSLLRRNPGEKNTLSENFIRSLATDEYGNLWMATMSSGVVKYQLKKRKYKQYTRDNAQLVSDKTRAIAVDKKNRVWIGHNEGLTVFDPLSERFTKVSDRNEQLSLASAFTISEDYYGRIWVGTWNSLGLFRIEVKGDGTYAIDEYTKNKISLCSDKITFIYADSEKPQLFVGTNKGLNHILLDENGDPATVFQYRGYENDSTSLTSNFVWPIVKASDSVLWVGTLGGGLNRITLLGDGQYLAKNYGIKHGAPSNDIESLEIDEEGNLWIGSRGLSMFNPETEKFINYDYHDGLQGNSFKIGSSHKDQFGRLYFGGFNGVNYFYPDQVAKSETNATVAITDIYINNEQINALQKYGEDVILDKNINLIDKVSLPHWRNDINLNFASLNYTNPEKVRYRYKLIGIDDEWNVATESSEGFASYLNLPYGTYEFWVESSLRNGTWSGGKEALTIVIRPPYWKTPLAQIIYLILGGIALFIVFMLQKRWLRLKKDLEFTMLEETKMEELHQMRLKFFTNISHEFKTPLTLIISPVEKLLSTRVGEDEKGKLHKIIYSNATRLLKLINELMDFRKVETGAFVLRVQQGDIQKRLKSLAIGFEDLAERKGIKLKYNIDLDDLTDFWYDDNVVEKIVMNLLSNAFNYSEEGTIRLVATTNSKAKETSLANTFEVPNENTFEKYLYIKVSDNGIGITKASIQNIFDRYYRISDNTNRHLGSGVGLALVRSLVMLHKGKIFVSSERKVGSEFIIALPIGRDVYTDEERLSHDIVDQKSSVDVESENEEEVLNEEIEETDINLNEDLPTILLVEDNKELLSFLKDALSDKYNTLEAYNGQEALERVYEHVPDLIISDVMMPVMDGMELCQNIKSDTSYSHIPFILLTAKDGDESRITGTSLGADAYFSKPFNLTLLQGSIENVLESRKRLKERYKNDTFVEEREMVSNKKDKEFMDELIRILNENMDDPAFDIDHLCMEMGNSRTKLYNKIRSLTDLSVGEFIRRMRMKRAAEILLKENVSVYEVMLRVGMQSQSYFTKTFRKEFGVTPAQYKNKVVEGEEEEVDDE